MKRGLWTPSPLNKILKICAPINNFSIQNVATFSAASSILKCAAAAVQSVGANNPKP